MRVRNAPSQNCLFFSSVFVRNSTTWRHEHDAPFHFVRPHTIGWSFCVCGSNFCCVVVVGGSSHEIWLNHVLLLHGISPTCRSDGAVGRNGSHNIWLVWAEPISDQESASGHLLKALLVDSCSSSIVGWSGDPAVKLYVSMWMFLLAFSIFIERI